LADTAQFLKENYVRKKTVTLVGVNASAVVIAHSNISFRNALNSIDLIVPDGFWLQVAAKFLGYPTTRHAPVVKITYNLLEQMGKHQARVYLLGATDNVVSKASEEITRRYPGLKIAGARNGYFDESEEQEIVEGINKVNAQVILIGVSSPKRELFMVRNKEKLNVPLIIGVGGMIDILGGKTTEGPDWMTNSGLMWCYRLALEPKRLWKRYTITNFQFLWLVFKQALNVYFLRWRKS
jgi:N-acetylglucosaminyldiphosphoundecaprenol N-acetyl-beta-D-mannosaminyltransferase